MTFRFPAAWVLALLPGLLGAAMPMAAQTDPEPPAEGAKAPASDPEAPKAPKGAEWIEAQIAREIELPEPQLLKAPNNSFRARVPGKLDGAIEQASETVSYFKLDIGTDVPVECWLHEEELDLAASLQIKTELVFDRLEEVYGGKLELKRIAGLDAGAWDSHLYLGVDWLYRIPGKDGPLVGQAKHRIAAKGPVTVNCLHNELGYGKTFTDVVRALVETLDHRLPDPDESFYQETFRVRLGVQPIGVSQRSFVRDEEGDVERSYRMALLLPVNPETLQTHDHYDLEWSTPAGSLLNALSVEAENGEVVTNLALDPEGEDGWLVHGTFEGEELEAKFQAPDLSSALGETLALRQLMRSNRKTVELPRWDPSIDPTRSVVYKLTATERTRSLDSLGSVLVEAGSTSVTLAVDARGLVRSMELTQESLTFHIERIHVSGTAPRP